MATFMPLKDVTHFRLSTANQASVKPQQQQLKEIFAKSEPQTDRYRHDPYGWNWRVNPVPAATATLSVVVAPVTLPQLPQMVIQQQVQQQQQVEQQAPFVPDAAIVCRALVQFKCHHNEFSSSFELKKGQYVCVQGDRGIDIGVVIRINTDESQQYVERTGPSGPIVRHATQREVDYWATDLKSDEAAALEYCRQRVVKHRLPMDVRHAEYQFDKKKLTFYYEAKARVDFVTLLKELFREFSCRIWMEKVRTHE